MSRCTIDRAQREAVTHLEGPLLILAGPGSGKTRVVTHRVAWLLDKACRAINPGPDLHQQGRRRNGAAASSGCRRSVVWVGTFHRFCARLLRKYAPLVGLQENYTIYDTDDSPKALRQAPRAATVDRTASPPRPSPRRSVGRKTT